MAVVLHHSRAKGTAKLVLLGIANHQGDGGAWPSHATLARYANVDERNVRRAIEKLASSGEVRIDVQDGGGHNLPDHLRPNRYDVLVTCPAYCDRSMQHRDTRKLSGPQSGLFPAAERGGRHRPGGRAQASPVRGAAAPPEPSYRTPPHQVVPELQDARARTDQRPCLDCGVDEWTCQRRQAKVRLEDRHPYRGPARES